MAGWYNKQMKNVLLIVVVIGLIFAVNHFTSARTTDRKIADTRDQITISPTARKGTTQTKVSQTTLFVPYWSPNISKTTYAEYNRFVYFGVSPNAKGSILHDTAYNEISTFQQSTSGKKQYLTLRMLNAETNFAILEDTSAQARLIDETMRLIEQNDFDGIVLDLELSTIPLSEVSNNITLFVQYISQKAQEENVHFAMTMYGDVYFRGRPYDLKAIGSEVDELMIMAYDFHKPRGEPGPNFPLGNREAYGYDMQTMLADFEKDVPQEKLTVLFGMYGYDWTLGPQGKPLKAAKALPLRDIRELTDPCPYEKCRLSRNDSGEQVLKYTDDEGYAHELWFEDERSAAKKIEYLKDQNIGSVGYWVNGYW